jgi:hypothetical protein
MENLPQSVGPEKVYSFSEYFLKSRHKPGHVDAMSALEALSNPVFTEEQRIGDEVRTAVFGESSRHPRKYIRVVLLGNSTTIHNAFLDRGVVRRIGRNA